MKKQTFKNKKEECILDCISNWSDVFFSQEICGFIGIKEGIYTSVLCNNKSRRPKENFTIDPVDYLLFVDEYEPVCVFHSHVLGDETMSEQDIIMSENTCLPFLIYSLNTKKFKIHEPTKSQAPKDIVTKFKKII